MHEQFLGSRSHHGLATRSLLQYTTVLGFHGHAKKELIRDVRDREFGTPKEHKRFLTGLAMFMTEDSGPLRSTKDSLQVWPIQGFTTESVTKPLIRSRKHLVIKHRHRAICCFREYGLSSARTDVHRKPAARRKRGAETPGSTGSKSLELCLLAFRQYFQHVPTRPTIVCSC